MSPPERWEGYTALGNVIPGTRLITFKVPLKKELCEKLPEKEKFTPRSLVSMVNDLGCQLRMVIDLTFTTKYYGAQEMEHQGVRYEKIFTEGHNVPSDDVVYRFFDTLESFYEANKDNNHLVGVHCTHGVNRTGYVVCRYMIERLGFEPDKAMAVYHEARGHPVERENYIEDLRSRQLNNDYKYEGREKLPMKKVSQGWRRERHHNGRRSNQEKDFHHNSHHRNNEYQDVHRYHDDSQKMYGGQTWSQQHQELDWRRDKSHMGCYHGDQQNWNDRRYQDSRRDYRYQNREGVRQNDQYNDWRNNGQRYHHHQNSGHQQPPQSRYFRQGYRDGYNDERFDYHSRQNSHRGHYQGGGSYRNQRGGQYKSRNDRSSYQWKAENRPQIRKRHCSGEMIRSESQSCKRQNSKTDEKLHKQCEKMLISDSCSSTLENNEISKSACAEETLDKTYPESPSRGSSARSSKKVKPRVNKTDELQKTAETGLTISGDYQQ
ncbi:RNA/RNP complex-1-interacting phosphatase-like [Saccostrea echinata]|uniref:RNA/RNP complex-1-interacting phosphatase-like n=1 Tax=Saccostrea echinata TaxID=191078 RepID=UPI002A81EE75|nr:RNA/RNP complex-1-interacting phosphatase-like [Saccostrea echinata]